MTRMNIPNSFTMHFAIFTVIAVSFQFVQCQYFNPEMNDQLYLNKTHDKVKSEVSQSRKDLVDQVEIVRSATRAYIGAKIKENLFKALRILAEKELETMSMQDRPRQPRQDEDDDDAEATTETGLIPQLASIVKAIFGSNVNVTKYVEQASKLLPRPIGNQLVGVVSLLDPNQFTTTTAPIIIAAPTAGPVNVTVLVPQYVQNGGAAQQQPSSNVGVVTSAPAVVTQTGTRRPSAPSLSGSAGSGSNSNSNSNSGGGGDDDDDDGIRKESFESDLDEDGRRLGKQFNFKGINPLLLINGVETLWKNFQPNETTTIVQYAQEGQTTESDSGFDDDFTTKPSRVVTVVNGVKTQAEALRKGVPDLFQGAREAYKFLETVNGFLDKWSERLAAGSVEEDDSRK